MPNYSAMSDQELMAQVNGGQSQAAPASDYSKMSDQELMAQVSGGEDAPINTSDMYGSSGASATSTSSPGNESATPINFGQAVNLGTIRTPEYKAKYLQQLFPNTNVAVTEDGRIQVGDSFVEPKRQGFVNWLKDNSTKLGEWVGEQGLPMAGQIGADLAATAAAPETGGASLLAMGAANAAGAAAGTGIRQAYANQLIGEPGSASDVALQGVAGGAAVPIAAAVGPVLKGAAREMGSMVGHMAKPLGDAFPSIAESLFNVSHMNSEWLLEQMRLGRPASEIINQTTAAPEKGGKIVRNLLFGDANAKGTPQEFIQQYQRLVKPLAGDAASAKTLDEFFGKNLGLSQDTLDVVKTKTASELLDKSMTDPRAWRNLADYAVGSIGKAEDDLQVKYGQVLQSVIEKTKDQSLNIKPFVETLKQDLEKQRIVENLGINKGYTGKAAKEAYNTVLGKFGGLLADDTRLRPSGGAGIGGRARGKGLTAGDLSDLIRNGIEIEVNGKKIKMTPFDLSKMKVSDIRNIKAEVKPLFGKLFEGTGLSPQEKMPLAKFISSLDSALETLPGAAPLKEMNLKYKTFQGAKEFFTSLNDGGIAEQQGAISKLRGALSTDPATRQTAQSYLEDLDRQLGNKKILPRLKALGASQELTQAKYSDGATSLLNQFKSLHQGGLNQDSQKMAADVLKTVDNAVPQKMYKFYNDFRDHLTAEAFTSNRQNFLRVRALNAMLGIGLLSSGNPVLQGAGVLAGMQMFSPKGVGNMITGGERMLGNITRGGEAAISRVGGEANSAQGKALLAQLIRKKTGL